MPVAIHSDGGLKSESSSRAFHADRCVASGFMMIASELSLFANDHLLAAIDSFCPVYASGFEAQNLQSSTYQFDEISQRIRLWFVSLIGGFLTGFLLFHLPVRELLAKRRQLWAERPRTSQQAAQLRQLLRRVGRQYTVVVILQVAILATSILVKMIHCSCSFGLLAQGVDVPLLWILALETIGVIQIKLWLRYPGLRSKVLDLLRRNRWRLRWTERETSRSTVPHVGA